MENRITELIELYKYRVDAESWNYQFLAPEKKDMAYEELMQDSLILKSLKNMAKKDDSLTVNQIKKVFQLMKKACSSSKDTCEGCPISRICGVYLELTELNDAGFRKIAKELKKYDT